MVQMADSYHIQNLYVSYDVTDKFNVTAVIWLHLLVMRLSARLATLTIQLRICLLTGPFQNAGLKATYAFSDKVSLMAGIFNDTWNSYSSSPATSEVSTFGSQLFVSPVKGWTAYINLATGNTLVLSLI
jgi:hypothetical protein